MCLTGVSEHTILLELKMCQEGIAADATDYCKGLHLTVPLLKLNEFLQDGCYGEFLHQKAHFETGLAFVLQDATFFDVFDQFVCSIIEQFQLQHRCLQIVKILLLLNLHIFFFIEILLKHAILLLKLKFCPQLAVVGDGSIRLLQFFPHLPTLTDEVYNHTVDASTGSFLLEPKLILIPIISYSEDEAFLMRTVHLRHPQSFDSKLMPRLFIFTFLDGGQSVSVAGDETGSPSCKRLLATESSPFIVEVLDGLLACQALHDAHKERDLRLPVHLFKRKSLEFRKILQEGLVLSQADNAGLKEEEFLLHLGRYGSLCEQLSKILEGGLKVVGVGTFHVCYLDTIIIWVQKWEKGRKDSILVQPLFFYSCDKA